MKAIAEAPALAEAMSMKAVIWAQFEQVAKEQEKKLPPLSDDFVLADSDLDSLCLAIIVARLEDALGFDPFSLAEDAMFPVTLRDFVSFYETYANGAG
jgi:acyl carrier protein